MSNPPSKAPPTSAARPHQRPRTAGGRPNPRTTAEAKPREPTAGLFARQAACRVLALVIEKHRFLDDALAQVFSSERGLQLEPRDRAFVRLLATTVLRHHGELKAVLAKFLEKPLPETSGSLTAILQCASAQLLFLGTPPHAAISLAVDAAKIDPAARRFSKLANAVLRRVATEGPQIMTALDAAGLNVPAWMLSRWSAAYGAENTKKIAHAIVQEPPLDITTARDAPAWAERLGGVLLSTGSIRIQEAGRIEELSGYSDGAWWVQDAAAALPARLLGDVAGQRVADLCAAPGGKTAQLCAAGAKVTAVDISPARLKRVAENLGRLKLEAELVAADVTAWSPEQPFDAILLDAPCTATGTIRRHPDILHIKSAADIEAMTGLQAALLDRAAAAVQPGGQLVYCTCSLEPDEGVVQIERFLSQNSNWQRMPLTPEEIGGDASWITPRGDLTTLPFFLNGMKPHGGIDGFFAARLRRT
jgi:16S rRNA (cytosine967-C5)-methyltransferase